MNKPIKARPQFYAACLFPMQEIAVKNGYNLIVHGSMNRDMDLVAIPWVDNPSDEKNLIRELDDYLKGVSYKEGMEERGYMFSVLPGGRRSYVINLYRGGPWNQYTDEQYYIDISITPLLQTKSES